MLGGIAAIHISLSKFVPNQNLLMTPSLSGFLTSLFLGAFVVIIPISFALITVSRLDPIARQEM